MGALTMAAFTNHPTPKHVGYSFGPFVLDMLRGRKFNFRLHRVAAWLESMYSREIGKISYASRL